MEISKSLFIALHNQALAQFEASEAYQKLCALPKVNAQQRYGFGEFEAELPTLNHAIEEKTGRRMTDENFVYKQYRQAVSTRYQEESDLKFGKTALQNLNTLAQYVGYASWDAFKKEMQTKPDFLKGSPILAKYVGCYEGFYLKTGGKPSISTIFLEIRADGKATLTTIVEEKQVEFEGKFEKIPHSKMLKGTFISSLSIHAEEESYHFYYFLRDKEHDKDGGICLSGFYGGKGKHTPYPMAGKLRLYKLSKVPESYQPMMYPIHSTAYLGLLHQKPSLMRFFLGKEETIRSESVRFFEDADIIERTFETESVQRMAGTYMAYHVASVGDAVSVLPILIHENGMVVMKSSFDEKLVYKGVANTFADDQILALRMRTFEDDFHKATREEDKLRLGILLFYKSSFNSHQIKHLIGVYSMLGEALNPISGRVVLVKKEGIPFEELQGKKIPIDDEAALDAEYEGLSFYLADRLNNLIKVPRSANEMFKQKPEYAQLFYKSACYDAQEHNFEDALKNLRLAFNYGFRDRGRLIRDRESCGLKNIPEDIWQVVDSVQWTVKTQKTK